MGKDIWKRKLHCSKWFWIVWGLFLISFFIVLLEDDFSNYISFVGIFSITLGSILALRPGIRKILNKSHEEVTGKKVSRFKEIESNENSTILAFFYILQGFVILLFDYFLRFDFFNKYIVSLRSWGWFIVFELIFIYFAYNLLKKDLRLL